MGKRLESLGSNLVRAVNIGPFIMTTRLDTIATRQRQSRARDLLFAAFVALAAVISVSTVATAADAASTHVVSR